jgi:5-methylcytosine-specific restriction endonuclease McrA
MGKGGPRPELRAILRQRQKGRCCYCGIKMRISFPKRLRHDSETIEHLNRRTDGGGNERDNIALACHECNSTRGNVDWLVWKTLRSGDVYDG